MREYWMVDAEFEAVTVLRRHADGSFPIVAALPRARGDVLMTPLMERLTIQLNELFA